MILGGGKIGYNTAKSLADNKFNVILVEQNKTKAFELADQLPNVMVIHGDGRNVELLEEEGLEAMDAFICVTGNSENQYHVLLDGEVQKSKKSYRPGGEYGLFQLSQSIGIDTLINKKLLTANTIFRYIRRGEVVDLTTLNSLNAEILEFIVKPESKVNGMLIRDIDFPRSATIGGVIKEGEGIIALGDYCIEAGDRVVVCSLPRALAKVESLFL